MRWSSGLDAEASAALAKGQANPGPGFEEARRRGAGRRSRWGKGTARPAEGGSVAGAKRCSGSLCLFCDGAQFAVPAQRAMLSVGGETGA